MRQEIPPRWRDRIRVYPLLMAVAYVVVFAGGVLFRQGLDPYAPKPRDFMAFWLVADLAHVALGLLAFMLAMRLVPVQSMA